MTTTTVSRADALLALGALREQSVRLAEMAEELHAQTSALELFVQSVFSGIDRIALEVLEGSDELARMFEDVQENKVANIDRMRTLELYEATSQLANAVEAAVMRERNG